MTGIDIVSTCLVQQSSPNFHGISRLDLTAWDVTLLFLDPIQKGVLFHKPEIETSLVIDRLKTSLSRALDFFPPLAGRLVKNISDDNTANFFVDCNNTGASFTHTVVCGGARICDILDPIHVPTFIRLFFPLNGLINSEGVSNPLLGVQVTELDDGFFIACTMNHSIADGTSFWHFFNSWAEICRGSDSISRFPDFERSVLSTPQNDLVRIPIPLEKNSSSNHIPQVLVERIFHIPKDNIGKLKSRANIEVGTDKISSLQSLLAHIWRGVTRCRALDPEVEVLCTLIIGTRSRLSLSETYFGNAIYSTPILVKNRDLLQNSLGWIALELNKAVISQTNDEVMRMAEYLVNNPRIFIKDDLRIRKNIFLVGSSPRHNVYGTDFGWGKPLAVRSGEGQKCDGKITIFPAAEEGGIDVEICLAPETLLALSEDAEFMEVVK